MLIDPLLRAEVALVVGANGSLGAACARALAAHGAAVLLAHRGEPHPALEVEAINDRGGLAVAHDLGDEEPESAAARAFAQAEESLGPVSILVLAESAHEADTFVPSGLQDRDPLGRPLRTIGSETLRGHLDVYVRGAALLIAELTRRHVARGADRASVVPIVHWDGRPWPAAAAAAASQAALESLACTAASELARYGIRVNRVRVGPTAEDGLPGRVVRHGLDLSPPRRLVDPAEAADVVVFLASHQARRVTGQVIQVGEDWSWTEAGP